MKTKFTTRNADQFAAAILLAAIIFMAISWLAGPTKMANSSAPPTSKMGPVTITSTRLPIEKMALIVISRRDCAAPCLQVNGPITCPGFDMTAFVEYVQNRHVVKMGAPFSSHY